MKVNTGSWLLMLLAMVLSLVATKTMAQTQPNITPVFFTSVVGGDEDFGRRVLLRWDSLDGVVQLDNAVLFRTNAANQREKIAVVKKTRSLALIESIFYREGEARILADAQDLLTRVYGEPAGTPELFGTRVIELLDGKNDTQLGDTRRNFMVQTNYGFAIVEGVAYLDFVDPGAGPFTYELWQGNGAGEAVDALGKIVVDASVPTVLPAPANLREVFLLGRDGVSPARANNRRIFLNWDVTPDLKKTADARFGYSIYRLNRALNNGETYEDVKGEVVRVNKLPILEPSPIEGESADQTYIFADDGDWLDTLEEEALLPVGQTYTYWAVARDLLGNDGLPSNALEATVRDTWEPEAPRGLSVAPTIDENHIRFLRVFWNPMDGDIGSYRIYRYQDYSHAGKKGPFADINGLKEGFIDEIIPPILDPGKIKVTYDDYESNTAALGQGFWYAVSAVDTSGNESPLSPAVYGVLDDVVGPQAGRITEFCVSRPLITVEGSRESSRTETSRVWNPQFIIRRTSPAIARVHLSKVIQVSPGVSLDAKIETFEFNENDFVIYSLTDATVQDQDDVPVYRFVAVALDGSTEKLDMAAPTQWSPGNQRIIYRVEAGVSGFRPTCDPLGSGVTGAGLVPVIPGGDAPPFQIKLTCSDDIETYRLYRSVDGCKTYELVEEVPCDGLDLLLKDNYHPETITEVCYNIVPVDKHGNLGTPKYLEPILVFLGNFPAPTMISANAAGLPGSPQASLRWIGPKAGVQFYRVHFENPNDGPRKTLEYRVSDIDYDAKLNEFSLSTSTIDRDGNLIVGAKDYNIFVEAVSITGASRQSDKLPFIWASKAFNGSGGGMSSGVFRWNARPLPPVQEYSPNIFFTGDPHRGVAIEIRRFGGGEVGVELTQVPHFPFMVWRQRMDKPNQPWHAVSPLIETINFSNNTEDDGFFAEILDFGTDVERLYFIDNSGHVQNATYRYLFMEFDAETYEIERLLGPFSLTILIPG